MSSFTLRSINMDIISEYRVMRSAAGWYIGQQYYDKLFGDETGYWLPYDRISGYYPEREMVVDLLREFVYNDLDSDDDEYILTRLYFEDRVSFWHNLENFS
jgi:hypothetical protein